MDKNFLKADIDNAKAKLAKLQVQYDHLAFNELYERLISALEYDVERLELDPNKDFSKDYVVLDNKFKEFITDYISVAGYDELEEVVLSLEEYPIPEVSIPPRVFDGAII